MEEVHERVMEAVGASDALRPLRDRRTLAAATEHQARARVALTAALAVGPSHAYLFSGPRGAGKRAAARAFAAEILAAGAGDPDDAAPPRPADPSPHPDLVWLARPGRSIWSRRCASG